MKVCALIVVFTAVYCRISSAINPGDVKIPSSILNNPNKPKFLFFPTQHLTAENRRAQAVARFSKKQACLERCKRLAEFKQAKLGQTVIRAQRSIREKRGCGCGCGCCCDSCNDDSSQPIIIVIPDVGGNDDCGCGCGGGCGCGCGGGCGCCDCCCCNDCCDDCCDDNNGITLEIGNNNDDCCCNDCCCCDDNNNGITLDIGNGNDCGCGCGCRRK